MKNLKSKLLLSATFVLLSFSLTACGGDDETTKDGSTSTQMDTTDTNRDDNIVDDVKDGVKDVTDDIENGVNDITNDVENGVDNMMDGNSNQTTENNNNTTENSTNGR